MPCSPGRRDLGCRGSHGGGCPSSGDSGADAIKVAAVINAPHPEIMKLLNMIEEVN